MHPLVIGLTGGMGSGKTTVANLFAKLGAPIIDTDIIARDVIQPNSDALQQIVQKFGSAILLANGSLNRAALRNIIFNQASDRVWLEELLHPLIREEMKKQISRVTSAYCIAVIPLLLETKPNPLIERILVVDAPEQKQIERTRARDNLSVAEIQAILNTQAKRAQRLAGAHEIIYNDSTLEELQNQVKKLHEFYLSISK